MSMDIGAKPGALVVFAHPNAGYPGERDGAIRAGLIEGQTYQLRSIRVGQSITYIELAEHPGLVFNSVQFDDPRRVP